MRQIHTNTLALLTKAVRNMHALISLKAMATWDSELWP